MDHEPGSELISLSEPAALPTFDLTLRGYDRRQVDEYLDRLEQTLSAAQADRDAGRAHTAALQRQVEELQAAVNSSRQKLLESTRPTYAGLGERVAQLLRLAEEEAERLRSDAVRDISHMRESADGLLSKAQEKAARAEREFESTLAERRKQADQQDADKRKSLESQLRAAADRITGSQAMAMKVTTDAKAEADRLVTESRGRAESLRKDAEKHVAALVQAARQDADRLLLDARREAERIVAEAGTRAEERRGESEREIAQLMRRRDAINQQLASVREVLGALPLQAVAERTEDQPGIRAKPVPVAAHDEHRTVPEHVVDPSLAELSRFDRPARDSRN